MHAALCSKLCNDEDIIAMIGTCPVNRSKLVRFLKPDECHECTCWECDHVDSRHCLCGDDQGDAPGSPTKAYPHMYNSKNMLQNRLAMCTRLSQMSDMGMVIAAVTIG